MSSVRYRVEFTKSSKKELDRLPRIIQDRVLDAAQILAVNPFTELLPIKKIKGADDLYRLRIGDYRMVYKIRPKVLVILVVKIGHRKDVYRDL